MIKLNSAPIHERLTWSW